MPVTTIAPSFPDALLIPRGRYADLAAVRIGRPLTLLGSNDNVHVRLRSRTISPVHAAILNIDGRIFVRDLCSEYHILVNKQVVREAVLNRGDRVRIGRIRFQVEPSEPAEGVQPEGTIAAAASLCNGEHKTFPLTRPIFVVGSHPSADFILTAGAAAAAIIFTLGPHRFIRNLEQDDSVQLNGLPVSQSVLVHGDMLQIRGEQLQFSSRAEVSNEQVSSVETDNENASRFERSPEPAIETISIPAVLIDTSEATDDSQARATRILEASKEPLQAASAVKSEAQKAFGDMDNLELDRENSVDLDLNDSDHGRRLPDDLLPQIRRWGPLAAAMVMEHQPKGLAPTVMPTGALATVPATGLRRWRWISVITAIIIVAIGVGAWFSLRSLNPG